MQAVCSPFLGHVQLLANFKIEWGDPDALSEAGFCYANSVGCKKDLKKSAKFYRMAEAKGVNMVGNSWIWKDKYLDEEERAAKKNSGGGKKK